MAEQQSIFRKQSIDSVSSPEDLNDYIKSATPSAWFIMAAVIILLIGICVWGFFGHLDTRITVGGVCEDNTLTLYFPEDKSDAIKSGMKVDVGDISCDILSVSDTPVKLTYKLDPYALHMSGLDVGDFGFTATAQADLPDGTYKAVITVESVSPLSFVIN